MSVPVIRTFIAGGVETLNSDKDSWDLLTFKVPGRPQPWQRVVPAGMTRDGRRRPAYSPKEVREYERRVLMFASAARRARGGVWAKQIKTPCMLFVRFVIPKVREKVMHARTATGRTVAIGTRVCRASETYEWPVRNEDGDVDNLVKSVKDGLTAAGGKGGGIIANDKLIVAVLAWKEWGDRAEKTEDGQTGIAISLEPEAWMRRLLLGIPRGALL